MAKIFVGIAVYDHIDSNVRDNQQQFLALSGHQITYKEMTGMNTSYAKTQLCKEFLKTDCEYFLSLDADIVVLNELDLVINKLLKVDKDIVGGVYVYRKVPCRPVFRPLDLQKYYEDNGKFPDKYTWDIPNEPFEVQWAGDGMKLIKRKVIEAITKEFTYPHITRIYKGEFVSHDWSFDQFARDLGFSVWMQPDIELGHIGNYAYTLEDYRKNEGK